MAQKTALQDLRKKDLPIGYSYICPFAFEKCFASQIIDVYEHLCSNNHKSCANFLENNPIPEINSDLEYEIGTKIIGKRKVFEIVDVLGKVDKEVAV